MDNLVKPSQQSASGTPASPSSAQTGGAAANATQPSPLPASFFANYCPTSKHYDELLGVPSGSAEPRSKLLPHWKGFCDSVTRLGARGFQRRWDQAGQMLRENGIAYGSPGQAPRKSRPWIPDPLPILIPAAEWEQIAGAIEQRAHLLSEILADLLGPQRLLRDGLLPPEVVFRHPQFRRPLWSDQPRRHSLLQLYAADIARDPDGKWWVIGDRTESPSGLGFALENRLLVSRMLPDPFHTLRVKRLASFFIRMRETIASLAPPLESGAMKLDPRVVLLTRGEGSARYFEDTFLARYLGYTLASGQDLVVRGNRVMFKTLGGLVPVDVILRRPDTGTIDPLEMISDERNGAAGLLQALRLGGVRMINPPGSGLVETPVLMSFMPFLCERMFGEPLRMPAVATWWLGSEAIRRKVLKRLDSVVIRPAFERPGPRADLETARLSSMPRTQLIETINARPHDFIAQERVARSSVPIWDCENSFSRSGSDFKSSSANEPTQPCEWLTGRAVVRVFQVRTSDTQGYATMSGGLARVRLEEDGSVLDPRGGMVGTGREWCKDVWVLSDTPVRHVSLLSERTDPIELRRGGAELPSRVADNLFWVGRHLERTDAAARLLRAVVLRLTGEDEVYLIPEMSVLLRAMVAQDQIAPDYAVPEMLGSLKPLEKVLPNLVFDANHFGGLRARAETLVRTASTVRDRISFDSWRAIRKVGDAFEGIEVRRADLGDVLELAGETILGLAAFSGLASESMTRTPTWRFLDLGRRLERAAQSVAILRCACELKERLISPTFVAILEYADSLMTYRSRYQSGMRLGPVCDLLMSDRTNPRAIAYQLSAIIEHMLALPTELNREPDERLQQAARDMLEPIDAFDLSSLHQAGAVPKLLGLLEKLDDQLPKFSDAINHRYFVHAPTDRPLGGLENHSRDPRSTLPGDDSDMIEKMMEGGFDTEPIFDPSIWQRNGL
jgi:uncharacterized circularly permuted ATP-grasp superfamily protein/uncharacterized alpha-E superfamily protein